MRKTFEYPGFEAWSDIERDFSELFYYAPFDKVPAEGQGLIRITVEYTEEERADE